MTTPRQFTGLVFAQASQPLSQLWKIHLSLVSSKIGEDLARETLRQQRQDTAYSVRDLYYRIAQTQTQIENAEANEKYLVELEAETDRNLAQQTALKGDSLLVRAKLSQQRYQLLNLRDTAQTQKESMNRLLGRELSTPFSVETQPIPTPEEIDLSAARKEALEQRTEVREARASTASRRREQECRTACFNNRRARTSGAISLRLRKKTGSDERKARIESKTWNVGSVAGAADRAWAPRITSSRSICIHGPFIERCKRLGFVTLRALHNPSDWRQSKVRNAEMLATVLTITHNIRRAPDVVNLDPQAARSLPGSSPPE